MTVKRPLGRWRMFLALAFAALPLLNAQAAAPTYTITVPMQPGFVCFTPEHHSGVTTNQWMNKVYVSSAGVSTNNCVSCDDPDVLYTDTCRLVSSEIGFSWARNAPEYYLADVIKPPTNVDWKTTRAYYDERVKALAAEGKTHPFLLDPTDGNPRVYAVSGGTQSMEWWLTNGECVTNTHSVSMTCLGRPRRIFWTDSPYNGPTISLQGKFVRLFGDTPALTLDKGVVTNIIGGVETVEENKVTSGVYIDETAQVMYAAGKPTGQFVLVYYDTGDYNNILCVEVIEVCKPEALSNTGIIGIKLEPDGMGYDVEGLEPLVTAGIGCSDDERGDYLYEHAGQYSYSPKNGFVFPIRPSVGKRWKAEMYWMETDPMGVQWPFELDQYENDWPKHGNFYVRGSEPDEPGAKIYFPDDYTAELSDFQEPDGHAVDVDGDNVFYTKGEGWSLIKLTTEDNVWFLPMHSVFNTNETYFTRKPQLVPVGQEFLIGGGTRSGVTPGAHELITATDDAPGYIYQPVSGTQYNADLYYETTNATADADSQISTDVTGEAMNGTAAPSVIYAVNEGPKDIEVWWSRRVQVDDMPAWVDIPTLPQVYRPIWPDATEAPSIVVASCQGSAAESLFLQYGAATFDKSNAGLHLAARQYFPNGTGMLSFWTRRSAWADEIDGVTNAPSALLQIGNDDNRALSLRIATGEKLELVLDGTVLASVSMPTVPRPNIWTHIALGIRNATRYGLSVNAQLVAEGDLTNAAFLGEVLDRCIVGRPLDGSITNVINTVTGLVHTASAEKIEAPTNFVACTTWEQIRANLEAGSNVYLTASAPIEQTSQIRLYDHQNVTLNLRGCEIYVSENVDDRMFLIKNGHLTVIGPGTFDGAGRTYRSDGQCAYVGYGSPEGRFTVSNGVQFVNMSATGKAGAVYAEQGAVDFYGATFTGCRSGKNGGAFYTKASYASTVADTVFTGCSASGKGGAICAEGNASVLIDGVVVTGCSAPSGGAVDWNSSGTLTLVAGAIGGCKATDEGAGVLVEKGTFSMYGGLIASNLCADVRSCVKTTGGTVELQGGLLGVPPTAANVQVNGKGSFSEPLWFGDDFAPLYKIGLGVTVGRQIAEVTMRDVLLVPTDLADAMHKILVGDETGITGYYSFRPGEDLTSVYQTSQTVDFRFFYERVQGLSCVARNTSLMTPGAPAYKAMVIAADSTPSVYYRNYASEVGYNPNEEHAFVEAGSGGYVAWALRGDLNTDASKPAVMVSYKKDGEAKMQFFHVLVTNRQWTTLAGDCTAGFALPGPHPLDTMMDPWLAEDYWDADPTRPGMPGSAYRDRKLQLWARCAGVIPVYMYYRAQEGFWFPQYAEDAQPETGTAVPWLARFADPAADPLAGAPAVWTWTVKWPETANVMKIGQSLYEATDGLPGVYNMKSVAVVYPAPCEEADGMETVVLSDPTAARKLDFDPDMLKKLGLSTDPNGGLTLRKGKYYFDNLPPHLSQRIYVDTTNDKLCFVGKYDKKNAGVSILYVNVLSSAEREQLRNVVPADILKKTSDDAVKTWNALVDELGREPVEPNTAYAFGNEVVTSYTPRDSYALTARGGTNWVVLIENDAPTSNFTATVNGAAKTVNMGVSEGDSVNMKILKVTNAYYTDRVVTKEDEQNLLSQRLTVMYTGSFGGKTDDFEFEWRYADPNSDGTIPDDYANEQIYKKRGSSYTDYQLPRITIGEQGDTLANMVNQYWTCRYRAKSTTSAVGRVMGQQWSAWSEPPALAEGWIQRVLNNVTPFNQLMTDLYENKAETAISMIAKAGKPYTGDVALNQDALTSCGLIELYETLLNKAESMSLMLGIDDEGANKQLLLAVERLGDMYTVLGDEAYTDAKNPTIGFGSTMTFTGALQTQVDFGAASSGLFCFDNQVSSLLDEELALLRGRVAESAPFTKKTVDGVERRVMNISPYYNRLLWNFTKGITAGEVAYAVNYNIEGTETVALSEEQAAALYPQGHGDAYGHYLSALTGWYRLLRNPYFSWPRAQGEMNVADVAVNVDYYEEAKFSEAALKVARTAADVVDLTARKAYGDTGGTMAGYRDEMTERAFGYGEWANRGAYGALVNWAVGNSLLPISSEEDETFDALYAEQGLKRIDRGTVDELPELAVYGDTIQRAEDAIDVGMNPLGLDDDAVPFDISPIGAADGTKTHYEQIRERAGTAVANARRLLDQAQEYSNRLRMIQEATDAYEDAIKTEELAYEQELIGYYGRPYADDIGPGATYEQGYEGPDLIHYMWMDISKYGIDDVADTQAVEAYYFDDVVNWSWTYAFTALGGQLEDDYNSLKSAHKMIFQQSANGLIVKPDSITGSRPMQGSVQDKYGAFLAAYAHYGNCLNEYEIAAVNYEYEAEWTQLSAGIDFGVAVLLEGVQTLLTVLNTKDRQKQRKIEYLEFYKKKQANAAKKTEDAVPDVVGAGMTVVSDPKQLVSLATGAAKLAFGQRIDGEICHLKTQLIGGAAGAFFNHVEAMIYAGLDYYNQVKALLKTLEDRATVLNTKYLALQDANSAVVNAIEAYNSEVAKAELVLERREVARKAQVNLISQARYNDMFFRQLRNQALARYSAAFDLAQKYVWEAAKAYDYETALLSSDKASGDAFLNEIVKARALGSFSEDGEPLVGDVGDTGLAGILARMDANWLVLKPRLGINNPQPYATWFSLRNECFRILSGTDGDAAWSKELQKYWTDDITANADFRRYCQPFYSRYGTREQEPGLVIPFETTVDFAKNLFGNDLAGGDHAYDSTWYATRIYSAGVWFDGYNAKAEGSAAQEALAATPVVYLVPMGMDCMRVPGLDDGEVIGFNVVEQVIPAPYTFGASYINDLSWFPTASDGDLGGADATTKIRKHPSFRAYFDPAGGSPSDAQLDCTRLVGRSAWNTKWMLVIPAGAMNVDREKALSVFMNGSDTNRDGKLDLLPVRDIRIGFKTYSNSGN